MAIVIEQNSRNYPAGTRSIQGALDAAWALGQVTLTRESWPVTVEIILSLEYSTDNGQTWRFLMGATANGGPAPSSITRIAVPLPDAGLSTRRLRATFTNTEALTTAITVEAF